MKYLNIAVVLALNIVDSDACENEDHQDPKECEEAHSGTREALHVLVVETMSMLGNGKPLATVFELLRHLQSLLLLLQISTADPCYV